MLISPIEFLLPGFKLQARLQKLQTKNMITQDSIINKLYSVVAWYSKKNNMKRIIIFSLLLAFATTSFCQQTVQKHSLTQADYLQKSKKQKKTAMIFLGGGVALIVTSIVIPQGEPTGFQIDPITGGFYEGHKNDGIKGALVLTGVVSMLGSIPFFIASGKNKRRASKASAFFNMEKMPVLQGTVISNQSFPALGVKINL